MLMFSLDSSSSLFLSPRMNQFRNMLKMPSRGTRQLRACGPLWETPSKSFRSCAVPSRRKGRRSGTGSSPATGPTAPTQLHLPQTDRLCPTGTGWTLKHCRMLHQRRMVLWIRVQTAVGNSSCLILSKKRRRWEIPV